MPGLLFLLVMWATTEPVHSGPKPKTSKHQFLKFHKFDNCPGIEDPFAFFNYTNIKKIHEELYAVDGTCIVSRTVPHVDDVEIMLSRCGGPRNECKFFNTLKIGKQACAVINLQGMLWSRFSSSFHPRFECPVKKGVMTLTNGTFDMTKVRVLNLPTDGQWKVDIRILVGTKIQFCYFFIVSVINAKPR